MLRAFAAWQPRWKATSVALASQAPVPSLAAIAVAPWSDVRRAEVAQHGVRQRRPSLWKPRLLPRKSLQRMARARARMARVSDFAAWRRRAQGTSAALAFLVLKLDPTATVAALRPDAELAVVAPCGAVTLPLQVLRNRRRCRRWLRSAPRRAQRASVAWRRHRLVTSAAAASQVGGLGLKAIAAGRRPAVRLAEAAPHGAQQPPQVPPQYLAEPAGRYFSASRTPPAVAFLRTLRRVLMAWSLSGMPLRFVSRWSALTMCDAAAQLAAGTIGASTI
mmetsp:Transcript_81860/g.175375  ORF Transcript_81860/g.175375 Transcript_81860/m.175375 type:complete len:277 (-) Transcript_81860:55-885(-)